MIKDNNTNLGFEQKLWATADKLRNNMDAAEYKHVVLGLIFLKYISDAFEEKHSQLEKQNEDPENRDEYLAENIFWVPKEARWSKLIVNAKSPNIGVLIDDAMDSIEKDNSSLKGVLPKNYARPALDKQRLIELAKEVRDSGKEGQELGLTENELAFYRALADNKSAVEVLGNDQLGLLAKEIVRTLKEKQTIDWAIRDSARAKLRLAVRAVLRKYGYPPDAEKMAILKVIEQAETSLECGEIN